MIKFIVIRIFFKVQILWVLELSFFASNLEYVGENTPGYLQFSASWGHH